jgi:hypothetical protein
MDLTLTKSEIGTILNWFEYVSADSMHYGNGIGVFPFEKHLLDRLNACNEGDTVVVDEAEIGIIYNWMESAIDKSYGSEQYLTPSEKVLHDKLMRAMGE